MWIAETSKSTIAFNQKCYLSVVTYHSIAESISMPTFLVISKHSPENCPMFNEKARKVQMELMNKSDELMKKHGVKNLGSWAVPTEHLSFEVYEAPSLDAFGKLGMEPEILALSEFETYEIKLATSFEEAAQMLKQIR